MTSLAFLSIARVGHRKMPHVPTNTERLQAFRRYQPVQFANTTFPGTQPAIALPSRPHSPAAAGWVPFHPDSPGLEESDYFTTHSYAELAGGF